MIHTIFLNKEEIEELEFEVIPQDLRVYLTRKLERSEDFLRHRIINQNWVINRSRSLCGKTIYVLEGEDYEPSEYAWHSGEFELVFRRTPTVELIELLCEVLERAWLSVDDVNLAFSKQNSSIRFGLSQGSISVHIRSVQDIIDDEPDEDEHSNIRILVQRMESALKLKDFSAVLHASASIFETLAKDIIGNASIQNQTLGGFFAMYQNRTNLPPELQQKIIETYNRRNTEPLAGHGSTVSSSITEGEAITLCELTKAFVKIEYSIKRVEQQIGS